MTELQQTLAAAAEQLRTGDLTQAEKSYRAILEAVPDHVPSLFNLALIAHHAGRLEEAIGAYRRVLELEPESADAYNNLGNALKSQGRLDEAEDAYCAALRVQPDYTSAQINLGMMWENQGRIEEAEEAYRAALQAQPRLTQAHIRLGNALESQGRIKEAEEAYRAALALAPDEADTHVCLGLVLETQGRLAEAEAAYRRAIALKPRFAGAHINLGNVLETQGRIKEAEAALRRALAYDPDAAGAHMNLANVLKSQGRLQEAEHAYRETLRRKPDYAEAYSNLVAGKRYTSLQDDDAKKILALLASPDTGEQEAMYLHFALGKIYDDCKLYDEAFSEYRRGNEIKHKTARFDTAAFKVYVDRIINTFDSEFIAQQEAKGSTSELPVFIVGMPRSGTTLVEQIISSHPRAHGAGELDEIHKLAMQDVPSYPEGARVINNDAMSALAREYEGVLQRGAATDTLRVSDKMPLNFMHLGFISLLFPRAHIVHCVRDPWDVCLSIYFQYFPSGHDYAYDLDDIAAYYREYERLMSHWRRVLPAKRHDVVYEDLVTDQKTKTEELIAFLELPWHDRCLSFTQNRRPVQTASMWQVRQPIYTTSVHRWRRYAKHLRPLKESLGMRGTNV